MKECISCLSCVCKWNTLMSLCGIKTKKQKEEEEEKERQRERRRKEERDYMEYFRY